MAFNLAGSTITQTGTDANLSALSGVAGVTVTSQADIDIYNIGDRRLVIEGDLTIDPEIETLLIGYDSAELMQVQSGASLTIGQAISVNGFTRYSEGLAIYFDDTPAGFIDRVDFNAGSTLTWNGGIISMHSGKFGFYSDTTTIRINSLSAKLIYRTTDPQNQIRQETDDFISTAFELINGDLTVVGTAQQLNGYQPTQCSGAISFSSATPNVDVIFRGYAGGGRGNAIDFKMWQGCRPRAINSKTGTEMNVGPHIPGNTAFGIMRVYQDLEFNVTEFGSGAIEGAKIWFQDYDNGNRRIYNQEAPAIDLDQTFTYQGTSDVNGDIASQEILIGGVIADSTYGSFGSVPNAGMYAWDYRGKNNDSSDLYDIFVSSYNHNLQTLVDVELKGVEAVSLSVILFVDTHITELDSAVVNAYTDIDTSNKLYDRAKTYLVDNFAGETSTLVTRSGDQIDFGSFDVTVDATAAQPFDVSGNLITIRATTFAGSLITTGLITLSNGATVNGIVSDTNGSTSLITFG